MIEPVGQVEHEGHLVGRATLVDGLDALFGRHDRAPSVRTPAGVRSGGRGCESRSCRRADRRKGCPPLRLAIPGPGPAAVGRRTCRRCRGRRSNRGCRRACRPGRAQGGPRGRCSPTPRTGTGPRPTTPAPGRDGVARGILRRAGPAPGRWPRRFRAAGAAGRRVRGRAPRRSA